jgi:PAS domain-containing protein
MPDSPDRDAELRRAAKLRKRAAGLLSGPAATKGPLSRATDALAALQSLALQPDTAAQALALLHELQVHQVELELQAQELREARVDLETDLRRYVDLYRLQPTALLTVDVQRVMYEINPAAAKLLGVTSEDAVGRGLDPYLDARSRQRLVAALVSPKLPPTLALTLRPRNSPACAVQLAIGPDAVAGRFLLGLVRAALPPIPPTAPIPPFGA